MRFAARPLLVIFLLLPALATAQTTVHTHYGHDERADAPAPDGSTAPRLQNLGAHKFPVTTRSAKAQAFVNQGVNLAYGFNHAESGRAFREAARLDSTCAMAYWGQALVLGPNINAPMDPADEPKARGLADQAMQRRLTASARDRALIEALDRRYRGNAAARAAADSAYATAMDAVARRFPKDDDVLALWAESAMDLRPWNYWRPDGTPYPGTNLIRERIETVMKRSPNHPGALHYYIHLMEPTHEAVLAEPAADRLLTLMPAAGHIVHMPSHIYQRIGRYADAVRSNELAVLADEDYITQCRAQGLYPMAYYPHNLHFLWAAASMEGRSELAIATARKTAAQVSDSALVALPLLAGFRVVPWYALTRFGHWDEMLDERRPASADRYLLGTWMYARGLALIAKGKRDEAGRLLDSLRTIVRGEGLDYTLFSPNTARRILSIAPEVLAGELAAVKGDPEAAVHHLETAVRLADGLTYTEPEEWHYPPRHALGAVLLAAGRAREAETVYWEDLQRHPENGWALRGLAEALAAQGRDAEAADARARAERAWARADVRLTGSRFAGR
jgi:tetratricopeptide (TPR) repeat protein